VSKVLLDTDIYSEVMKAVNPTVTQNAVAYRQKNGVLTLSAITVMEIVRGFQQNQSVRRLQDFLTAVVSEEVLIFDKAAAEHAGRIEGELVQSNDRLTPVLFLYPIKRIIGYQLTKRGLHALLSCPVTGTVSWELGDVA
jgi:predicted nucleic acid-binding protein